MFGWCQKEDSSGAANLAALFNNAGDSGIEHFANMLNKMGEKGGTKLGAMHNGLDSRGTANYSAFRNMVQSCRARLPCCKDFVVWLLDSISMCADDSVILPLPGCMR